MAGDSEESALKTLASIRTAFDKLNEKFLEALARLEEATTRISALIEIHLGLARTIMDVLGIPEDLGSATALQGPMVAISSAVRAKSIASGLLRPIIRNLGKSCRDISQAINVS